MCNEWINIKDRLPEKPRTPFHPYLVWKKGKDGPLQGGIIEKEFFGRDTNCFTNKNHLMITHWMKLPEPPKDT